MLHICVILQQLFISKMFAIKTAGLLHVRICVYMYVELCYC